MADHLGIHFHGDDVLAVRCPFCGAQSGELCESFDENDFAATMYGVEIGRSIYAHQSRIEKAERPIVAEGRNG